MKKKLVLFFAILSAMICLFAITAMAAEIPEWPDEVTTVDGMSDKEVFGADGTVGATSRVLMSDGVAYPAYYIFKNSTTLGITFTELSGYSASDIVRLEVPKGVTSTGTSAFKTENGFTSLKTVVFPEGFTTLGEYTFKATDSLPSALVSVSLPSTLQAIGQRAFTYCGSLEELIIPEGITEIPIEMANYTTSLKTLKLPSTIKIIGQQAFRSSNLSNGIIVPEGCTEIVKYAFRGCSAAYVELPSTLETVGEYAFAENEVLTTLCSKAPMIGDYMFKDCFNLEFVTLENTKVIKKQAFNMTNPNIAKISKLALPEGLTTIGEYAFVRLSITELITPSTLSTVDKYAFAYCKSLKKVVVLGPTIGTSMFADGGNTLEELVLTNRLTSVGSGAFSNVRTDSFITYYTGNEDEAASFKSSFQGITTRFKDASYCSYEDYINGNGTTNKYMFVYGTNLCVAAFDGVHTQPDDDGDCTTALVCSVCADYTYKEAKEHVNSEKVTYVSFDTAGIKKIECTNAGCTHKTTEELPALFTCLGYSAPEDGRGGIAIGFTVNNVAIKEYTEATGKTLKYGVFAVLQDRLGNNDVFAEDGTVADGVINADIADEFVAFELKIEGFTDEYKATKLAIGAYVAVTEDEATEYFYMQSGTPLENEKYCFVSYNDIVGTPSTNEDTAQ